MKCIYCQNDSKYRDRTDGRCPSCKHAFAFEPGGQTRDTLTDLAFLRAIERVSAKGSVHWTAENLYYELCRSQKRYPWAMGFVGLLFFVVILALSSSFWWALATGGGLGLLLTVGSYIDARYARFDRTVFLKSLTRWRQIHGEPAGYIAQKALPAAAAPPALEADIPEYSFDRAVICDRPETVDLLIANNFHFENNCAVLGIDGYPPSTFAIVRKMLKRNPRLQIFALHDASIKGCGMARRLAKDPEWFLGHTAIIDVGLRPAHAEAFKGLWEHSFEELHPEDAEGISPTELRWLRRNKLPLSVVRPEQLIKRLFRAISQHGEQSTALVAPSEVVHSDVVILASEATVIDGGGDSFG